MRTSLLLIIGILIGVTSFSQIKKPTNEAITHVLNLKENALFVKLETKRHKIAALRERGMEEAAIRTETEQKALNKAIINAFETKFDFCDVYFFYSEDKQNIIEGNFSKIKFYNEHLEVREFNPFYTQYYTAEYGINTNARNDDPSKIGINALVLYNKSFEILPDGFPYYSRTFKDLPFEKDPWQVVEKLNKNLRKFYEKHY